VHKWAGSKVKLPTQNRSLQRRKISANFRAWGKVTDGTSLILKIPEFPYKTVWDKPKKQLELFSCVDRVPACDRPTDRHWTMANTVLAWSHAVTVASPFLAPRPNYW